MLREGTIPQEDQIWSVIAIFKKGDKTLPSNYRGISLIELTIKMLTTVVTHAVQAGLEQGDSDGPFFVAEQGGFRARREGVAQFIALWEICDRRKRLGLPTYCIWYDQKKAFDKVGHVAALTKLKETGMSESDPTDLGLRFIKGLYKHGKLSAKVQSKISSFKSYLCGVRQGCPFSPTFYLVFINDIFDSLKEAKVGVDVPGWPQAQAHFTDGDISDGVLESFVGLLFADDMCAVVSSISQVKRVTVLIDAWGAMWEMSFGISKCGIAVIEPDVTQEDIEEWRDKIDSIQEDDVFSIPPVPPHGKLFQELRHANLRTRGGELIPIVEEYEYLGLKFNCWLNKRIVIEDRRIKGAKTLFRLRRFIGSNRYPTRLRVLAVSSMLIPVLTYGAELFGMENLEGPLEAILTNAVGMVIRGSWEIYEKKTKRNPVGMNVAIDRVYMELGISSIKAATSAARTRGTMCWRKQRGKTHSVMSQLLTFPMVSFPKCSKTNAALNPIPDPDSWEGRGIVWLKDLLKWATSVKGAATLKTIGIEGGQITELSSWAKHPLLKVRDAAGTYITPQRWQRLPDISRNHQDPEIFRLVCRRSSRLVQKMEHARKAFKSAGWLKDVTKSPFERSESTNNTTKYVASGSKTSARHLRSIGLGYPKISIGFHWIHRIRVGGLLSFKDAERCGYPPSLKIRGGGSAKCPCCLLKNGNPDGLEHYVLSCRGPLIEVEGKPRRERLFKTVRDELNLQPTIVKILLIANQVILNKASKRTVPSPTSPATPSNNSCSPASTPTSLTTQSLSSEIADSHPTSVDTNLVERVSSAASSVPTGADIPATPPHSPTTTKLTDVETPPLSPKGGVGDLQIIPDDSWVTDAVVMQALLSGSKVSSNGKDRLLQILNLKVSQLPPELKSILKSAIGTSWQGNFRSKVPVREACSVLLARFLLPTVSSRSSVIWKEYIAEVNARSAG
jgi:hypothetical protein